MIIVEGFVQLAPGELDRLRPVAVEMLRETRKEVGCLDYAFAEDLADPNTTRIIERWESEEALTRHFATPHMAKFNAALTKANLPIFMSSLLRDNSRSASPVGAR